MSGKDLIHRPDIWGPDLSGRLNRLHEAAQAVEAAYSDVESRDATRARRQARRSERLAQRFPGFQR